MFHLLPHLLQHIFKLIAWADEKLPDSKPLGWKLAFIGVIAVSPFLALSHFPNLGDTAIVLIVLLALSGCVCLVLGSFILFRRAVWRWQDRRSDRIISMRWK